MTPRSTLIAAFLATTQWSTAARAPLAGDASSRRYERLTRRDGTTAVLMDAPPDAGETIEPFVRIALHLRDQGLNAPAILAQDPKAGFLLLEDLGDAVFARVIQADPQTESRLYLAACDVLLHLHQAKCPPLTAFNPALMTEQAGLIFTSYFQSIAGPPAPDLLERFQSELLRVLSAHDTRSPVMIMRDYHAENLLWLPDREGLDRVGLLDFQDAVVGHPAYDLASLLLDIRRNVTPAVQQAVIRHYIDQSGVDEQEFVTAYTVLGVQRNLRIIAVFARLSTDFGKPHYVDMIPRAWDHVMRGLQHPILAPLADILIPALPAPTPQNLQRLRTP